MIFKIFRHDLRELRRSVFTLIIALGVCVLGGLYAWANIYSNWDPYGNTRGIKIAVVSLDRGDQDSAAQEQNMGAEIVDKLRHNDKIDWVFLGSEKEARAGVESGDYYGALIVGEDFSEKMTHIFTEGVDKPQLVFYQNQKKNAVANKITDTVVTSIQSQVNEKFVEMMVQKVFTDTNHFTEDLEKQGGIDGLISRFEQIRSNIASYQTQLDMAIAGNEAANRALGQADKASENVNGALGQAQSGLGQAQEAAGQAQLTLEEYSRRMRDLQAMAVSNASDLQKGLEDLSGGSDMDSIQKALQTYRDKLDKLDGQLHALAAAFPADLAPKLHRFVDRLDKIKANLQELESKNQASWVGKTDAQLSQKEREDKAEFYRQLDQFRQESKNLSEELTGSLPAEIESALDKTARTIGNARVSMNQMSSLLGGMGDVFGALSGTVNAGNVSLIQTRQALTLLDNRISAVLDAVKGAGENDAVKALINTLSGDPQAYGRFFADPVEIKSTAIYPVENYGSAVAPFYSVLAIWVMGLLLAAVMKTHPNPLYYPDARAHQLYLGRYLIFGLLEQFFVVLLVLGDLFVLKIQCLHPFLFWAVCAVTGLTFSLLIYSLVYAFGDVGKAAAVVIVVLQIAGSSGTYPIELLPTFFQNAYIFFPFPYAIDALRECVAGLYRTDILIYLGKLSVFILVALAIGIWMHKPTARLLHFMEARMDDTELM